jgi:phage/plasmid-like protein (TIGR03299 family)
MTSSIARDVNAEFASQKFNQIAGAKERNQWLEGEIAMGNARVTPNADGSSLVTILSGWDRNETFTLNKDMSILANHGLDVLDNGNVALYLKDAPAWHALGTVIPGGLSDSTAVLKAAGLDWEVGKTPALYKVGDDTLEAESSFITYRKDTGASLGMVGSQYTPLFNRDSYEILDELFGLGMIAESGGSLNGGRRVFITAELPNVGTIDPNGINDKVRQFLAILNSHDGKTPVTAIVTPWRIVCKNTNRLALKGATGKWTVRHTTNVKSMLDEAKRTLGNTVAYFAEFTKEAEQLVQTPFSANELDKLCDEIWEVKADAPKRAVTLSAQRRATLHEIYKVEIERCGENAYAAEQAITGYVDHFAELRPRGDLKGNRLAALGHALMSETLDKPKADAHKRLMLLTNR